MNLSIPALAEVVAGEPALEALPPEMEEVTAETLGVEREIMMA